MKPSSQRTPTGGKRWLVVLATVLLVATALSATPASAWVGDEGTKNCSGVGTVAIKSDSFGDTYHFRNVTQIAYWYLQYWDFRYSNTGVSDTYWQVLVYVGGLDGTDTYAYCAPT